jgi:hypothetical protein
MAIWNILLPFGIFYGHLEYFMAIWYNLWPSGKVFGHLIYLSQFWYVWTQKNLAPWSELKIKNEVTSIVCVPPTMAKGKLDLRVWFSFLNSSS